MSRKIIGVTVGTPLSPAKIEEKIKPVKTVNGVSPDASGNVEVQGGVSDDDIREAFETALQQAKDSGEFDGEDGHTPVKGTDYFTEADKQEIVAAVLANFIDASEVGM